MDKKTRIKKLGQAYDLLSDCGEVYLKTQLEEMMLKEGYKVVVSRDKYKFKWVGLNE
jgi:hypothetical protein